MGDTNAIPTGVWIRAELIAALREAVRIVDEQQIAEGEAHTEQQIAELDRVYEAAADIVDPLEREGFFAARAVVDAVETEAAPDELTALRRPCRPSRHVWVERSSFGDPYRKCERCGKVEDA